LDCRFRVTLALELAPEFAPSVGTVFEHPESGAQRAFLLRRGLQALQGSAVESGTDRDSQFVGDGGRHRPRRPTVHRHPNAPLAARIGLDRVDPHDSSSSSAPAATGSAAPSPSCSLTFASTSASSAGLSLRKSLAFSRPCPIRWSP